MAAPPPERMSTISDVAREAGVSVATVSRALRGLDRVSPTTREKVLQVARDLDYVASPTATSLASGRTKVVGVASPYVDRWYFAHAVSALQRALRAEGYYVMLLDLDDGSDRTRLHLDQAMLWKRVDGVITINVPLTAEEVEVIDRLALPHVTVGTVGTIAGECPRVQIDDHEAARLATQHLLDLGHTHIAYVGALPPGVFDFDTPTSRRDGVRATLEAAGHGLPDDLVVVSPWTAQAARESVSDLLTRADRPTAVVAGSDEIGFGVVARARDLGLRVPEDLSVVGIDDHALSGVWGLSTVRQDIVAQGRTAADLLLAFLRGEQPEAKAHFGTLELVPRQSTAAIHGSPA